MELRIAGSLSLLTSVVIEQVKGIFAKSNDCHEVAGSKQSHTEVNHIPSHLKGYESTYHYHHAAREETVDGHHAAALCHEADVRLTVIVVGDNAGEGKEENGNGNKGRT